MNCKPVFGRLTVLYVNGATAMCQCSCGSAPKLIRFASLKSGNTESCGCLAKERQSEAGKKSAKHGQTGAPEYRTWQQMRARCASPENKDFKRYGGLGIRVCEEWESSFATFLRDMGPKPSAAHSIDRRDNALGYSPSNCRWATPTEQTRNRRIAVNVTLDGITKPLVVWCGERGINYFTAHRKLRREGRTPSEVFA
jgi:hypothetical protein